MTGRTITHFGLRTPRLQEMVQWYERVLEARVLYQNDFAAFLTFDEEHHRLALWTDEATTDRPGGAAGIDHICIGLPGFETLAGSYERLEAFGITPSLPVNHRFTTSLYYNDPDGNELELSVDNFATKEEAIEYLRSGRIAEILTPPFGDTFDPRELVRMVRSGASREQLARIGSPASGQTPALT